MGWRTANRERRDCSKSGEGRGGERTGPTRRAAPRPRTPRSPLGKTGSLGTRRDSRASVNKALLSNANGYVAATERTPRAWRKLKRSVIQSTENRGRYRWCTRVNRSTADIRSGLGIPRSGADWVSRVPREGPRQQARISGPFSFSRTRLLKSSLRVSKDRQSLPRSHPWHPRRPIRFDQRAMIPP